MIPFKDDNPTSIFPFVTIALIVMNTVIFIMMVFSPARPEEIVRAYGAVPRYLLTMETHQPVSPVSTLFSSMFMHGGPLHLIVNMLYLWIFGNNIEDRLGHVKFIIFYLLCGIAAAYSHALADPGSMIPMIGASGAVAGILGAYLLLFPYAGVYTLIFFGFFVRIIRLPAMIVLGFWMVIQFLNGLISKGAGGHAGIAWFAHIGGFIAGLAAIKPFLYKRKT